ncbi:hypothetical protein ACFW6C_09290 [Streptomyces fungicidicus]|uniref:hypothetical protein n=1 Tax=Streptomyces fungicidicus TaxID=68203 RepID=UPI003319D829
MDDSLSFESLFDGASKAAQKAMEDHGRGEYDEFALHAGVAIERLAKAVLVKMNPLYLVEMRNGNADMLLYFGGHLDLDTAKVRTVGAKEAIQRLRRVGVLPADSQLDLLIELRNGTAHTTVGDEAKTLLPALAETTGILLTAVATRFRDFWGRWSRTVIMAVDKQRDEIQRDVEIRIDQARHRFEDKFEGLPSGSRERVLGDAAEKIEVIGIARGDDELLALLTVIPCPSCKGNARVKVVPVEAEEPGLRLQAESLHCFMCKLDLHTPEEIRAASVAIEQALLPTSTNAAWATSPSPTLRVESPRPF